MHTAAAMRHRGPISMAAVLALGWCAPAHARGMIDPGVWTVILLAVPLILLALLIWLWIALRTRPRLRAILFALVAAFVLTPVPAPGGGAMIALFTWVTAIWADTRQVVNAFTACALAAAMLLTFLISAWPRNKIRDSGLDSSRPPVESESAN